VKNGELPSSGTASERARVDGPDYSAQSPMLRAHFLALKIQGQNQDWPAMTMAGKCLKEKDL